MRAITLGLASILFSASAALAALPILEGTEWGPENGLGQYVQFKASGELFGFAGCNSFVGKYTQRGDRLTVTELSVTKTVCEDMMGAEAAFLDGIKGSHRLDIVGGDIRVYNADDRWILGLRQRY